MPVVMLSLTPLIRLSLFPLPGPVQSSLLSPILHHLPLSFLCSLSLSSYGCSSLLDPSPTKVWHPWQEEPSEAVNPSTGGKGKARPSSRGEIDADCPCPSGASSRAEELPRSCGPESSTWESKTTGRAWRLLTRTSRGWGFWGDIRGSKDEVEPTAARQMFSGVCIYFLSIWNLLTACFHCVFLTLWHFFPQRLTLTLETATGTLRVSSSCPAAKITNKYCHRPWARGCAQQWQDSPISHFQ